MTMLSRWGGRLAAVVVAVGLSLVMVAGTAQAGASGDFGETFVDGGGVLTDDWGDHYAELGHSLCYRCPDSHTELVAMWEAVLYAEGFLSRFLVDGYFSEVTRDATKKWQARYGLSVDGMVGNATWSRADQGLHWTWDGKDVYYDATGNGEVWFTRGYPGTYQDEGAYRLRHAFGPECCYLDLSWTGEYIDFYPPA